MADPKCPAAANGLHAVPKGGKFCSHCKAKLGGEVLREVRRRQACAVVLDKQWSAAQLDRVQRDVLTAVRREVTEPGLQLFRPPVVVVEGSPSVPAATTAICAHDGALQHSALVPPDEGQAAAEDDEGDSAAREAIERSRRVRSRTRMLGLGSLLGMAALIGPSMMGAMSELLGGPDRGPRRSNYRPDTGWPLCPECDSDLLFNEDAGRPNIDTAEPRTDDGKVLRCVGCDWYGHVEPQVFHDELQRIELAQRVGRETVISSGHVTDLMGAVGWRVFLGLRLVKSVIKMAEQAGPERTDQIVDGLIRVLRGGENALPPVVK